MNDNQEESEIEVEPEFENQFEDEDFEATEETLKDKVKQLRHRLKECETEKSKNLEDLQRAKAEFLNSRRRLEDETFRDRDRQINSFVEKLTPMADSFSMAMSNKETWEAIDKNWRIGVESIYGQLQSLLKDFGVIAIDEPGVDFDPNKHEAVATIEVDDAKQDHKVISIIQTGYERMVGGKSELIRPARVTVGEYTKN